MTRPTPQPIEWTEHQNSEPFFHTVVAELGRWRLFKTYYFYDDIYIYGLSDSCMIRLQQISASSPAKLLRLFIQEYKAAYPEVYAALASITSDEDWREIND